MGRNFKKDIEKHLLIAKEKHHDFPQDVPYGLAIVESECLEFLAQAKLASFDDDWDGVRYNKAYQEWLNIVTTGMRVFYGDHKIYSL